MPGFNIVTTGGDAAKEQPSATFELNRAHRWKIQQLVVGAKSLITEANLVYVKSITLPAFNVEEEIIKGGSISYKFAKGINWEDVTVVFYDVEGILEQIEKIRQLVWTPDSGLMAANDYKGITEFWLTNGDGDPTRKFFLENSWVKNISHSDLTYTSSDIKEVTLVISYDWAREEPGDGRKEYDYTKDAYKGENEGKADTDLKRGGKNDLRSGTSPKSAEELKKPGKSGPRSPAQEKADAAKAAKSEKDAKNKVSQREQQAVQALAGAGLKGDAIQKTMDANFRP